MFVDHLADVRRPDIVIQWQKSFQAEDRISRTGASDVLALSSFLLSSIPAPLSRKAVVKEMWESGAHTIVVYFTKPYNVEILTSNTGAN